MQKICTKYDRNMHKYAGNMQRYAKNMQVYAKKMQEICKYVDCISQNAKKYAVKICKNMPFYMQNMQSLYIAYFAFKLYSLPTLLTKRIRLESLFFSQSDLQGPYWGQPWQQYGN